jgi:hypothetical protein
MNDLNELLSAFLSADYSAQPLNLLALVLGLCLAFLAGLVIAWTYMITHAGLSYSRAFVNALVVIPMIVSVVMMVLNNNLVTAFGLMAVFAVVRFRNVLRDTLDTSYMLAVLAVGMACGTQRFSLAVIATLTLMAVMIFLWATSFGTRHRYDAIVNLHWGRPLGELAFMTRVLERHSRSMHCATQRSAGQEGVDLSYRLLLRDPSRLEELLSELRQVEGVSRVTSIKAEQESEL